MHQYECGNCGLRSGKYLTRFGAERYGKGHRDKKHGGMFPINEGILTYSGQAPQAGEWRTIVLVAAILLIGLASKLV